MDTEQAAPSPEVPPRPRRRRRPTADRLLLAVIVLLGSAASIRVWLSDRGFWNDELYIAINLRDYSMWQLTGPLKYYQSAPPGWLMANKVMWKLFGDGEQVLRFGSMVAAIVTLILVAVLASRMVGRFGAVLATALVALAPMLHTYAGELKQYTVEAAVALILLLVAESYAREENAERSRGGRAVTWALLALLGVTFSYSAAIVFAAAFVAVLVYLGLRRRGKDAGAWAIASIAPLAMGTTLVILRMTRPQLANQQAFFKTGFPPEGSGLLDFWTWVPDTWVGFVQSPLRWNLPLLVLALVLIGFISLVVRRRYLWALLLFILAGVAVGAAAVHGLPLEDRIALYLLAPTAALIAAGCDGLVRGAIVGIRVFTGKTAPQSVVANWFPPRWQRGGPSPIIAGTAFAIAAVLAFVGFGFSLVPAVSGSYAEIAAPKYRDRGREVIRDVKKQFRPGDVMIAYGFSKPLVSWYGRGEGLKTGGLVSLRDEAKCRREGWPTLTKQAKRIWYVHGATLSTDPPDFTARVLAEMAPDAKVIDSAGYGKNNDKGLATDPGWILLKPGTPTPNPPTVSADPKVSCLTVLLNPNV